MGSLMDSLGLDKVEADPNALPDGKYDGIVAKDEYVVFPKKNTYNHVLTYQVTEGDNKGASRQEVFTLVKDPVFDDAGNLTGGSIAMTDQNKVWYKKRLTDLGLTEEQIHNYKAGDLQGTKVTFGIKRNDGWINVNFAQKRDDAPAQVQAQSGGITGSL